MKFSKSSAWLALAILVFSIVGQPNPAKFNAAHAQDSEAAHQSYEPEVLEILKMIRAGELEAALASVERHVADYPQSRIGYLLKAEILHSMSPQALPNSTRQSASVLELKHQIKNRWQHQESHRKLADSLVPSSLIELGRHQYVMVADMQEGRLYLYENNGGLPRLVNDYYLSVGAAGYGKELEGDNKTPIGVYAIYKHISSDELPDLYGEGAYPVNYPNRFDRSHKRTGYGIWLHGTPSNTYARSPWTSEGCFVLSNDDLLDIQQYIDVNTRTPVILSDEISWISADEIKIKRRRLLGVVNGWKNDWESLNTDAYLAHYSRKEFNFGQNKFKPWAERKRQINANKTFVQIDMDIDSLFLYPGEQNMFVVKYKQRYLSSNYSGETTKEQYWQRDKQGLWKILYEG